MKSLFRLIAFIAFLTPFYAQAEVQLWLWQTKTALLPFLLPAENGDSANLAARKYVNAIRNQPELRELLGEGVLNNFTDGKALGTIRKGSEWSTVVANMSADYGASLKYRRIAGLKDVYLPMGMKTYLYPVAGAIHLSASAEEDTYNFIRRETSLVTFLGGADVTPELYTRRRNNPHSRNYHPVRDMWEMKLIKALFQYVALDPLSAPPVLAICRSLQEFNVFFGGSLIPDIPSRQNLYPVEHNTGPSVEKGHEINIFETKYNHLMNAFGGRTRVKVNSIHHQGAWLAHNSPLEIAAMADDGIIEALEYMQFLMVQFHPELAVELRPILTYMVKFAREFRVKRLDCEDQLI